MQVVSLGLLWGTSKTGLAPIGFHSLSRFRSIRSVPVPFLVVPFGRMLRSPSASFLPFGGGCTRQHAASGGQQQFRLPRRYWLRH